MKFSKSNAPVEVAGYVERHCYVVDNILGTTGWKWRSVFNDNYDENDNIPWNGDSEVDTCPF